MWRGATRCGGGTTRCEGVLLGVVYAYISSFYVVCCVGDFKGNDGCVHTSLMYTHFIRCCIVE